MKVFSSKKRTVPDTRKKYGAPESKKEMLLRQKKERETRETKLRMVDDIRSKNKDEFHFSYHSVGKSMLKRVSISLDELKKTLKYVDCEILRCERKLESCFGSSGTNKHTKLSDSKIANILLENSRELEEYVEILKQKRGEVADKISSFSL